MNILLGYPRQTSLPALAAVALGLLVGCAGTAEREADPSASPPWPTFASAAAGETVFRVDSGASQLRIRVDPEGPMARLGHSHIIGGAVVSGTVILSDAPGTSRLDLTVDATSLEVDDPEWRAAEGLKPALDPAAIAGTRANMRGEQVLDVQRHPRVSIRSVNVSGPDWLPAVTARIRLRGSVREVVVPVSVERNGRRLIASGALELMQTDFGIQPFSAAGGALRVSDRMRIRFRIVAEEVDTR